MTIDTSTGSFTNEILIFINIIDLFILPFFYVFLRYIFQWLIVVWLEFSLPRHRKVRDTAVSVSAVYAAMPISLSLLPPPLRMDDDSCLDTGKLGYGSSVVAFKRHANLSLPSISNKTWGAFRAIEDLNCM